MSDQVTAVMIAAAQSVGKVYIIGLAGWLSVTYPVARPLLPAADVATFARFSFHVLTLALIYSTTAQSVSASTIGNYWFVICGSFGVLAVAYATATVLGHCLQLSQPLHNKRQQRRINPADFTALRIAATFPNVVALPILIFPSLCEYPVVYEGYATTTTPTNTAVASTAADMIDQCVADSNAMVFCYFFSWSLVFWIVGYPQLMAAAAARNAQTAAAVADAAAAAEVAAAAAAAEVEEVSAATVTDAEQNGRTEQDAAIPAPAPLSDMQGANPTTEVREHETEVPSRRSALYRKVVTVMTALAKTFTSPGFLALAAGMVTSAKGFVSAGWRTAFLG